MQKIFRPFFLFVLAFNILSTSTYLNAWEFDERPFSINECKNDSSDSFSLFELYDRGVFLLASGDYYQARDCFIHILDSEGISEELIGVALWGQVWANAFLGDNESLDKDLATIANLIGLYEECECRSDVSFRGSDDFRENSDFFITTIANKKNNRNFSSGDPGCHKTVENCESFMKAMCGGVKDPGAKITLELFIEALAEKAQECCRAGGFWEHCVQKMVDTMNKWKFFGIPADPSWD